MDPCNVLYSISRINNVCTVQYLRIAEQWRHFNGRREDNGGGVGGGSPPFKRYLMLDWSSKRGRAEDLLSRELCKSVARGAFPSIFDPTPKNNPNYSVLKLEYPDVAKKRLSKLVLRPEKDNTLALCTYLRWHFIMTRIWLSIHVACGGFVSLSMVNPQPTKHSPLFLI